MFIGRSVSHPGRETSGLTHVPWRKVKSAPAGLVGSGLKMLGKEGQRAEGGETSFVLTWTHYVGGFWESLANGFGAAVQVWKVNEMPGIGIRWS